MATTKRKLKGKIIIPESHSSGDVEYYCTSASSNKKTGNVPTIWIGNSKEQVARTCCESGCPLLPTHKGGTFQTGKGRMGCYAWNGTTQMAAIQLWKKAKTHPFLYKLSSALSQSALSSRLVRLSAIGDPVSLTQAQADEIIDGIAEHNAEYRSKSTALRIIGYTHGWAKKGMFARWGKHLMASVHSLEEADEAFDQGWRPALEMSFKSDPGRVITTPKGNKLMVCPHLLSEDLKPKMVADCNECKWCVVENNKFKMGIVFPNHQ